MENKVKIKLIEPQFNASGTIYYAGFVNGVWTHFLSLDKLSRQDVKTKLLEKFKKEHILV